MMKKIRCTKKVALMYNVLEEKDGCIKTDVLLYSVLKTKKVERRTKNAHMYMVLIDNGWMINEKEALNKSATVNGWRMFCLNKKVVENLAQLKKKLNALGQSFELQKRAHNFYAQPNKALPRKAWKSHSKKGDGKRAPGTNRFWRLENMQETRIRKKWTLTQKWSQGLGIFSSRKER